MKLISTILLVLCLSFISLNAQVIANFEDGSTALGTIVGAGEDQQTEFNLSADNPDKTGINTSDKCLYILSKQVSSDDVSAESPGRPTWNGNIFTITLDSKIKITDENRFLHIMHNKERVLNNWLIYGAKGDSVYVELGRGTVTNTGVWVDLVVDVKAKLDSLKFLRIHLDGNWGGTPEKFYEPTKFYYDNIELTDDVTPRDFVGGDFITKTNLLDFEDVNVQAETARLTTQNAGYLLDSTYVNSDNAGLNTTSKCAYWSADGITPAWWHGIVFTFTKPVDAGANRYLHVMMKKSEASAANVQVSLFNVGGTQTGALMNTPLTTEWVDYVLEIPATHSIFTQIYLKFNTNGAPTVECFADEIIISNDPTPRVPVVTTLENKAANVFELYEVNGNIVFNSPIEQNVSIYSISGSLIHNSSAKSLTVKAPQSGFYIVRINNEVRKIAVN